jgi:23S rRNA (cytidine1920-2'-O)/16S rRNA (cytidine1409-2'-O)-methyltransferase
MAKSRIDDLLVERGLTADRRTALSLLMSGSVLVNGQKIDKAGALVSGDSEIRLAGLRQQYVSRGGLKLESALKHFSVRVEGIVCLDLGASTGGFTDCLLQHGAKRVYSVDVGKGQLDWKLQQDSRVITRDGSNVRYLSPGDFDEPLDLVTGDLSFISLRLVLPVLKQLRVPQLLLLVKPQFEAERGEVEPGGLIRDEGKRLEIVARVRKAAEDLGFVCVGMTPSPIPGQKGNREYFLLLSA